MIYNHRDYTIDFIDSFGIVVFSVPINNIRPESILSGRSIWSIAMDMYINHERRKA